MDTLLLLIVAGLCAVSSHAERQYHFVYVKKNMTAARSYCRENYTDLASFDSMEDVMTVLNMTDYPKLTEAGSSFRVWIGLYDDRYNWKWSLANTSFYKDGETEYRSWGSGQPNNKKGAERCSKMTSLGGWHDKRCEEHGVAVCSDVREIATPSVPVRLVNSNSYCSGRVEIFHNGQWGAVCDDSWDLNDAHVVCRQLGCGWAREAPHSARFGQGTGQIWLDDLQCSGTESSLTDCQHGGLGIHNCAHSEDASVICEEFPTPTPSPPVRLVNSNSRCSGRVEIFHNGQWGTVCDDSWDGNDAQVVCRQLGCGRALGAPELAHFGQGTGQTWLDDLQCSGTESSLIHCPHGGLGIHNCAHSEDASVICEEVDPPSPSVPVRLINSNSYCSGRVEIFHNGQWGTVCDDLWNLNDTQVVCRQLGCGRAVKAPHSARFGQGTGQIWLDDLQCSGSEPSLTDCQHGGLGNHNCAHSDDASVICEGYNVTFVFINISMTWAQAQSYCRAHYTDLASVRNRAEQLKVQELIPAEKSAWIGLFRDGWKWSDGSNLSFTNWRDGDPRGSATCVVADLTQNGTWINWRCDAERAFICHSKPKTTKQAKTEQATTKQATKKRATTKQDMKKQVKTKQVFRLKFKKTDPSLDLNNPDVVERILKQLKQKLKDKGLDDNIKLSWKKQPDGKVFHKEEKKTKKTKKKTKKVEL